MARTLYRYVSNGIRTVYPISFALGYLERDDIYVYQGEHIQFQENDVNFTWRGDFEIELERPFPVGEVFYIRRVVDRDKAINDYEEGAILRESNLDASFAQPLMILEELEDGFFDVTGSEGFVEGASGTNTPLTEGDVYSKEEVDNFLENTSEAIRNELDNIETIIENLDGDIGDFSDLIDDVNELRNTTLKEAQAYLSDIIQTGTDIDARILQRENEMGTTALAALVQKVKVLADGTAESTTLIQNSVRDLSKDVSANSSLLLSSGLTPSGDTKSLLSVKADVYDVNNGLAATFDLAGEAKTIAEGSAQAVGGISARVDTVEDFAQAQVTLNAGYDDSLDTLYARAFFGTNINGQVTGIYVGGDENLQQILFKSDAAGFVDENDVLQVYYDLVNKRFVFNGKIVAVDGEFTGEILSSIITGSTFRTSANTADVRVIISANNGDYLIWAGSGAVNDANALFYIKKNGTGFIKGSFFAGQLIESNFAEGVTTAALTHDSAGNEVSISIASSGSSTTIASNAPNDVGVYTYTRTVTVTRNSTTIKTGNAIVTRVIEYEPAESEYTTRDFYNFVMDFIDTGATSGQESYSVTIEALPLSGANQEITLKTQEDVLT